MSLSKPFPLLRLPRVPLLNVFKCIGVQEQFYLSICSSKAKYALKFYTSIQKFSVTFHLTNIFAFSLKAENSDDEFEIDVQTHTDIFASLWLFLSSVDVKATSGTSFGKNVKRLVLFLADVFNSPAISLKFVGRPQDFVTGCINFIHSLKMNIHYLKIHSAEDEDENVTLVMNSCREASEVHLRCSTTPRFDYFNKCLFPMFRLKKLRIDYAEWVSTWHLTNLFINCKHLDLYKCSTVHININQFLKEWMNGFSQLKFARLTFSDSMADIMEGIPSKLVSTRRTRWAQHFSEVPRIKQQKTRAHVYVIKGDYTIVITDSLQ
ncbi:hypothetical protein GCK72_003255 [Caenorhabditis remanei]|uniref:Sdz-33 F-box domain-containing protein n=1 Tax=Caenorhabditis remanei TaxID=31234 RepID=A0A6A5HUI0_CAERE|nr:hypothetical protein GCK72_003255 [Caenorhabditis remanei]KAF1771429.1 hypothetical protein GCK72_003255 [Caenorhabditis remanei]